MWASILLLVKEKLHFPLPSGLSSHNSWSLLGWQSGLGFPKSVPWNKEAPSASLIAKPASDFSCLSLGSRSPGRVEETGIPGLGSCCYRRDHNGEILTLLVCYGLLRCFICFIIHQRQTFTTITGNPIRKLRGWIQPLREKLLVPVSLSCLFRQGKFRVAAWIGIQHCNLHHLSLSGFWASGKLRVFVLD